MQIDNPHPNPSPEEEGLNALLRQASARLGGVSDTPRLDAELLLAHALGIPRNDLLLLLVEMSHAAKQGRENAQHSEIAKAVLVQFAHSIDRRLQHEPIAYITGQQDFYTITLDVGPGVLIPRPDSETLIEAAAHYFGNDGPQSILDLGTGPGTLLLSALDQWPSASGLGIDASDTALDYARRNGARIAGSRAELIKGDWAKGVTGTFDLILCNPPYVEADAQLDAQVQEYEPAEALFAGPEGLDDYRLIIPQLPALLNPTGVAILEIGWMQAEAVSALARAQGFRVTLHQDLAGRNRALSLILP
jgi:release factor glutamine methyltransferase